MTHDEVRGLQDGGRHPEALAAIEALMAANREDWEVYYLRARSHGALGRPSAMLRDLQIAVARDDIRQRARTDAWLDPWRTNPYVVLALGTDDALTAAWRLLRERKPEDALTAVTAVVGTTKHPGTAWFMSSVAAASLMRYPQAIEAARRTVAILPDFPDGWFNLGFACERLHLHDESIDAYRTATRVDPWFKNGWFNLGNTLLDLGRTDEALPVFAEAVGLHPGDPKLAYKHAECLAQLRRIPEAEAELERAARLDPNVRTSIAQNRVFPKVFDAATLQRLTAPR